MKMKLAEEIAANPEHYSGSERSQAFHWADRKRFDQEVSENFRFRAKNVAEAIWKWAGTQVKATAPKKYRAF